MITKNHLVIAFINFKMEITKMDNKKLAKELIRLAKNLTAEMTDETLSDILFKN